MFISRVEIPWHDIRNPYDIHRRLWQLFPGTERERRADWEGERQGFLFRAEQYAAGRPGRFLVQSGKAPAAVDGIVLLGTREFDPQPADGLRLAFVLTANPVKTIIDAQREGKPDKRSDKVRVPLVAEESQRAWLGRKVEGAAEVESVSVLPQVPLYFRKGNRAGKVVTAVFEGVLRVDDGKALAALLQKGLGPAKAFGCGLLLVRRAS